MARLQFYGRNALLVSLLNAGCVINAQPEKSLVSALPNYLKTYRKRGSLTQEEVAFLIGCKTGQAVSRYEHCTRTPNLRTAIALQAIFGASLKELFPSIHDEIEQLLDNRAYELSVILEEKYKNSGDVKDHKLKIIRPLLFSDNDEHNTQI